VVDRDKGFVYRVVTQRMTELMCMLASLSDPAMIRSFSDELGLHIDTRQFRGQHTCLWLFHQWLMSKMP
jgi:hypothetical protein